MLNESKDKDFAAEIYTFYLTETEERLKQMNLAVDNKDGAKIARIAHAVRGNSLAVGATSIADLAEQIQALGNQNRIEEVHVWLAKLFGEFSSIQTEFLEIDTKHLDV